MAALEKLKSEGKVGAICLGVQNHEYQRIAIESGRFDVIQSPYDYNLMRSTAEHLIGLAAEGNVGLINASPFLAGLLSGIDPEEIVAIRAATGMWKLRERDVGPARQIWDWVESPGHRPAGSRDAVLPAPGAYRLNAYRTAPSNGRVVGPRRPPPSW